MVDDLGSELAIPMTEKDLGYGNKISEIQEVVFDKGGFRGCKLLFL